MNLKNKTIITILTGLIAAFGLFTMQTNLAQAQVTAGTSMTIPQMQQTIITLQQQIQQMIALIAQLKPLETCGNGICRFGETAATCPADCRTTANCAKEGEKIYTCKEENNTCNSQSPTVANKTKCCSGLFPQTLNSWMVSDGSCEVSGLGAEFNTSKCVKTICGNSVCDAGENICNCREDCNTAVSTTMLSPNGGETWKVGETHIIKWATTNIKASEQIKVMLLSSSYNSTTGVGEMVIAGGNIPNSGSLTWQIPNALQNNILNGQYKIGISIGDGGNGKYDISNNNFTILPAQ